MFSEGRCRKSLFLGAGRPHGAFSRRPSATKQTANEQQPLLPVLANSGKPRARAPTCRRRAAARRQPNEGSKHQQFGNSNIQSPHLSSNSGSFELTSDPKARIKAGSGSCRSAARQPSRRASAPASREDSLGCGSGLFCVWGLGVGGGGGGFCWRQGTSTAQQGAQTAPRLAPHPTRTAAHHAASSKQAPSAAQTPAPHLHRGAPRRHEAAVRPVPQLREAAEQAGAVDGGQLAEAGADGGGVLRHPRGEGDAGADLPARADGGPRVGRALSFSARTPVRLVAWGRG